MLLCENFHVPFKISSFFVNESCVFENAFNLLRKKSFLLSSGLSAVFPGCVNAYAFYQKPCYNSYFTQISVCLNCSGVGQQADVSGYRGKIHSRTFTAGWSTI